MHVSETHYTVLTFVTILLIQYSLPFYSPDLCNLTGKLVHHRLILRDHETHECCTNLNPYACAFIKQGSLVSGFVTG